MISNKYQVSDERGYIDIQDHAIIGNLHTAAVISIDASVESYCIPNFDSPSVFARVLDKNKVDLHRLNAFCDETNTVTPRVVILASRHRFPSTLSKHTSQVRMSYPPTNSRFLSEQGVVSVTGDELSPAYERVMFADPDSLDFLPRKKGAPRSKKANHPLQNWLVRRVEVIRGQVPVRMECAPAFNYARDEHTMEIVSDESISPLEQPQDKVVFKSKCLNLDLRYVVETNLDRQPPDHAGKAAPACSVFFKELDLRPQGHKGLSTYCDFTMGEGNIVTFILRDVPSSESNQSDILKAGALAEKARSRGDDRDAVLRGAAALRPVDDPLLTIQLAAQLLQETNDYWTSWIGKSTYKGLWREAVHRSALALKLLTFEPTGAIVASPTFSLPEFIGGTRNWDYRASWIRDASFTLYALIRLGFTDEATAYMDFIYKRLEEKNPDGSLQIMYTIHGTKDLEEVELDHLEGHKGSRPVRIGNGAADHLQLYSKVMMWVAIDRGIRLSEKRSLPCPRRNEWYQARDTLYEEIMNKGYNKELGFFAQSYEDQDVLDASLLVMPLVFFSPPTEPRFLSTLKHILKTPEKGGLTANGLVFRYDTNKTQDGVGGEEGEDSQSGEGNAEGSINQINNAGAFSLTTLWAVEALGRAGHYEPGLLDQAVSMFEDFLGFGNHCGLFSEEISAAGEGLGNAVQGFTHVTLISAAYNLSRNLGHY
ncbi:hypothetical protein FRB99_004859 [Tulasnella sp. 403]|nr:hypothetical protein FRB99_004859 [Tulasnella sp. 403]